MVQTRWWMSLPSSPASSRRPACTLTGLGSPGDASTPDAKRLVAAGWNTSSQLRRPTLAGLTVALSSGVTLAGIRSYDAVMVMSTGAGMVLTASMMFVYSWAASCNTCISVGDDTAPSRSPQPGPFAAKRASIL